MLPGFLIAIPIIVQRFSRHGIDEIIGGSKAIKLSDKAILYDALSALEAAVLFTLIYRLLCLFRLNMYFEIVYQTIMFSLKLLVPYIIIVVMIILSCTIFTQSLWGTFNDNYRSFDRSFLSNTLAMIGGPEIEFWLFKGSYWSVVYFLCFFFWVTLLLPNVCIGVFMESYRITNLKMGYPEQYKNDKWDLKGYFRWLLQCCSLGIKNKLGLNEENQTAVNESDSD